MLKLVRGMNFVILGLSGCGKSTQAALLAKDLDLTHISTGRLFRHELENKTPLGIAAYKNFWGKGRWVPTPVAFKLLKPELQRTLGHGFVIEGWPRTTGQAKLLDAYLEENTQKIRRVFYLDTPDEIALDRLRVRAENDKAITGKVRVDDSSPEIIRTRFNSYKETIAPILKYYEEAGTLCRIDNSRSIEAVNRNILGKVAESI